MNIFVIEDEPPILRDILATIESFHEDYQIIGKAYNGQEALDFIKENGSRIDVLISDIQIPVVDGLEVIAAAHRQFPHILSIILTGYSNFDYARKAIQNQVFDYLLKPIDEEELHTQLQKAYTRKCLDYMKTPARNTEPVSAVSDTQYQIVMLSLGSFPVYSSLYNELFPELWKQLCIEKYFEKNNLLTDNYWIIDGTSLGEKIILFHIPDEKISDSRQYLTEILQPLCKKEIPVTIAVDTSFSGIRDVHRCVLNLKNFISKTIRIGMSQLLFYPEFPEDDSMKYASRFAALKERLSSLMLQKNIPVFEAELKNYVRQISCYNMPALSVYRFLCELLQACISACPFEYKREMDISSTITDVLLLSDTYVSLYENLRSIFLSLFEKIIQNDNTQNSRTDIILKVDAYMKKHYREPVNTKSIAEIFGFTPAYLSKMFRDYKSITPADYIIQLRMEKAKELLSSSPGCKIKDIAASVGYEDSLYFSKVFKKTTGMSPRQYIEHM